MIPMKLTQDVGFLLLVSEDLLPEFSVLVLKSIKLAAHLLQKKYNEQRTLMGKSRIEYESP
jgi:hypothetical protein